MAETVPDIDETGPAARDHLAAAGPVMAALVERYGTMRLTPTSDYFFTLTDSIASQQLSSKAAARIVEKIVALFPSREEVTPERVLELPDEELRGAGLSWKKVSYLKDLAGHVASGALDLAHIATMEDEEVIRQLVAVKGIGRWTAEMFLIFSLARPDVFAVDDYGLQVAVRNLHSLDGLPRPAPMRAIAEPWRPYRSYASLYLWRSLDSSPKVEALSDG